jgi:ribonuclease J
VVIGRAMRRAIDVATELGMLAGIPPFLDEEAYGYLPRDKVVMLLTGSQGEPRAALARAALDERPRIELAQGDIVVFSARAIPGNEADINRIINALVTRGVRVITDRDRLVHVSGHPRRDEMREMYAWLRPQIAIPVHGEPMHLAAHADLARDLGVPVVIETKDGAMIRLAPDPVEQVDQIDLNRLYKDGRLIGDLEAVGVAERRRVSFAGHVTVAVVMDARGELATDPDLELLGVPRSDIAGRALEEVAMDAVLDTIGSVPRPLRRDPEALAEAIRRAVRGAIAQAWGKKPICTVFVTVV